MQPKNVRNYEHKQGSGRDARDAGGPLNGMATPFTKAEKETNETGHYQTGAVPKDNLGGKGTSS